jgi:hypothetical protein
MSTHTGCAGKLVTSEWPADSTSGRAASTNLLSNAARYTPPGGPRRCQSLVLRAWFLVCPWSLRPWSDALRTN